MKTVNFLKLIEDNHTHICVGFEGNHILLEENITTYIPYAERNITFLLRAIFENKEFVDLSTLDFEMIERSADHDFLDDIYAILDEEEERFLNEIKEILDE